MCWATLKKPSYDPKKKKKKKEEEENEKEKDEMDKCCHLSLISGHSFDGHISKALRVFILHEPSERIRQ